MATNTGASGWLRGKVKAVTSGDCLLIMGSTKAEIPPEKSITLSYLMAPRLARRGGVDEPFAWESREFLRNLCIGKEVTFRVDYTAPNIGREFGTVYLGDKNVAYSVVSAGWARVKEQGPKGGEQNPYLTELLRLEEVAKQQGVGRWSKDPGAAEESIRDLPPSAIGAPPAPAMSDLRPPEHQVAGHRASADKLGPLVDGSGLFYKPLQAGDRGEHELAFYEAFSAHAAIPPRIRDTFFPRFHGTRLLPTEARPGEPHLHLVLDDLLASFEAPSVADIKIGAITWPPGSPEPYIAKCLAKDRGTTSVLLGFRISGVRVAGPRGALWRPERQELKALDTAGVRRVLRRYVSSVSSEGVDCALATAVFGGEGGVLSQLRELKAWFEEQTLFHFYSASILLGYDANAVSATGVGGRVSVKLVDFAHVAEGDGVIDHNFLGGLCSLIKFISDIFSEIDHDRSCLYNRRR